MPDAFETIARNINKKLGSSLHARPYVAILDYTGKILYADKDLDEYTVNASDFIRRNFGLLNVEDHSIPFSGKNLVIFKVTKKAIVMLYTVKGYVAQLLSFKSVIPEIAWQLDELLKDLPEYVQPLIVEIDENEALEALESTKVVKEEVKIIPILTKKIKEKDKFLIHEMAVLRHCTGAKTIKEIIKETKMEKEQVLEILEIFEEKNKIKYDIKGQPEYCPRLLKEIPEMAINLGIITKKELEISKLCDGTRKTIEILEELQKTGDNIELSELEDLLESMVKKKFIKMRFYID